MIDLEYLKNNIDSGEYFKLALGYYKRMVDNNIDELNEDLPENMTVESLTVSLRSISVLLEHCTIACPGIDICLDLTLEEYPLPFGYYRLIIDKENEFIDEFLVFN